MITIFAQGIMLCYSKYSLAEFSGHVELTNQWAYCLLKKDEFSAEESYNC